MADVKPAVYFVNAEWLDGVQAAAEMAMEMEELTTDGVIDACIAAHVREAAGI